MAEHVREALQHFGVPEEAIPAPAENWTIGKVLTRDDVWQYRNEPVIEGLKEAVATIWA